MTVYDTAAEEGSESHDVERGDEIVVDGVADSRQPMTVRVVYHDEAIKAIDQFKGVFKVSAGDVADRVDVVNEDDEQDDYVDLDSIVPSYRIKYRTATSDQADGSMTFSEQKKFVMDATEFGDGHIAGVDADGRDIYIAANKRINVRVADDDGAYRFLGYFRGFEEVER